VLLLPLVYTFYFTLIHTSYNPRLQNLKTIPFLFLKNTFKMIKIRALDGFANVHSRQPVI